MAFGTPLSAATASPASVESVSRLSRILEPGEWAATGIPLLRSPREVVTGLYERHLPAPPTAVVAVLGPEERVLASASFRGEAVPSDGWECRNALLDRLRRVIPHDLRRRSPVRTAVLLYCRDGEARWTEEDGAWMWGLRDACALHGLRCGAYIALTRSGWRVLGEGRGGRHPRSGARPGPGGESRRRVAEPARPERPGTTRRLPRPERSGEEAVAAVPVGAARGVPSGDSPDGARPRHRSVPGAAARAGGAGAPRPAGGAPEPARRTAAR